MNLYVHLIVWGCLLAIVIALFLYHRWLENRDDHYIHLHSDSHDSNIVTVQTTMARRIDALDKVKNGLLIAVIVYAVAIAAIAIYAAWNSPGS